MAAEVPRKRARLWLWLPLGALALWLLALGYYTFGIPHEVIHGDPLLEMYLNALGPTGNIRDDTLDRWDKMFPGDPRTLDLSVLQWTGQPDWGKELDYIKDYRAQGYKVSPAVLLVYIHELESQWRDETEASRHAPDMSRQHVPSPDVRNKLYQDWQYAESKEVDQKHRSERDKLYAELQQAAPKSSMTWYTCADLAFRRGDNALAIELLHKGNTARHNSSLMPYPLPEFVHDLRTNGPLAKDPRAGNLASMLIADSMPSFMEMKSMHRGLWSWAQQRHDAAAMSELHQYACRVATAVDGRTINVLVSQLLVGIECSDLQKSAQLTAKQSQALAELQIKRSKVKNDASSITNNNPYSFTKPPGLLGYLHMTSGSYYQRQELDSMAWEQHELTTKIFPQVDQIAKFDFVSMSFKP